MSFKFLPLSTVPNATLVIGVYEDLVLHTQAADVDKQTKGSISRALDMGGFKGKEGQRLFVALPASSKIMAVLLVGLGKPHELDEVKILKVGGNIISALTASKVKRAQILVDFVAPKVKEEVVASNLAYGMMLRSYKFDKYKTKNKDEIFEVSAIDILTKKNKEAEKLHKENEYEYESVALTRNVVSEPPNVIYPETLAAECKGLAKLGVKVEVLDVAQMKKLGMNALLGVGQGSSREPKLVVMEWKGLPANSKNKQPVAFIGKGVTFDSGGISIKPANGMEDMKYDMAGSAVVIGTIRTLAARKAKVNAVGVVGLVENMPGGNAQRPSDVVKSMSGQTIEVLNTDAEGRLVLSDALWYTQERFKPKFMIDLATLTGAIVIALGECQAGLFSNNDKLAEQIYQAGKKVDELVWRLPLSKDYDSMIKSEIADVANIVTSGKGAGSITAAQFLQRFVNDTPWAHLDIAGVAWTKKDLAITPKGATGFGVRLLNRLVADNFEA